jgi:Zn-finger nucleic acid-binding protein
MNCPICSNAMETTTYEGVELDLCKEHGVWMDQSELLSVTESTRKTAGSFSLTDLWRTEVRPSVDKSRSLICPKCSGPMKLEFYEGVHMDWCRGHGIWLDSGELSPILNNLKRNPVFTGKAALRMWENRY